MNGPFSTPLFDKVVLHLSNGKKLQIIARDRKNRKKRAKKVLLNGFEQKDFCIRLSELEKGGVIQFIFYTYTLFPAEKWTIVHCIIRVYVQVH